MPACALCWDEFPLCGAEVETTSISCGGDPHRSYRCPNRYCLWSGRSGLLNGAPVMVPKLQPLGEDEGGECDWGYCDESATASRYDAEHHRFLPVCSTHETED